jgi:hypothetical protein
VEQWKKTSDLQAGRRIFILTGQQTENSIQREDEVGCPPGEKIVTLLLLA